jgi:hypothetical protein
MASMIRHKRIVPWKRSSGKFAEAIESAMLDDAWRWRAPAPPTGADLVPPSVSNQKADGDEGGDRDGGAVSHRGPNRGPASGDEREHRERQEHPGDHIDWLLDTVGDAGSRARTAMPAQSGSRTDTRTMRHSRRGHRERPPEDTPQHLYAQRHHDDRQQRQDRHEPSA